VCNLELLYDLVDEGNEVVQLADVGLLQQTVHCDGNERQNVGIEADDHAVEELSNSLVQSGSLDRHGQRVQEDLEGLDVHLRTAVQLHRLLAGETFTRPTTDGQSSSVATVIQFAPGIVQQFVPFSFKIC